MQRVLRIRKLIWPALAIFLFGWPESWAHGPIHEQIARLDGQIVEQPENVELYFRRGRLFLVHRDWQAALADFDRVEKLDPTLTSVTVFRAEAYLGKSDPKSAAALLEALVALPEDRTKPQNRSRAFFLLGQARDALEQPSTAAVAYQRSIELIERPTPDHYLACARAYAKAGPSRFEEAIRVLDQGSEQLGSLVVLERYALELEVESKNFDPALKRIDRLLEQSTRRESWLMEKGRVLLAAGRRDAARASLEEAQKALESLPPHRRGTRAMVELAAEIKNQLSALAPQDASG